jgi:hypothetical protein
MTRQKERSEDRYGEAETARRRDDVIRRMIATPPKRHSEMKLGNRKPKSSVGASPKKRGSKTNSTQI